MITVGDNIPQNCMALSVLSVLSWVFISLWQQNLAPASCIQSALFFCQSIFHSGNTAFLKCDTQGRGQCLKRPVPGFNIKTCVSKYSDSYYKDKEVVSQKCHLTSIIISSINGNLYTCEMAFFVRRWAPESYFEYFICRWIDWILFP